MDDDSSLAYLSPDFDLSSLTVPRLRSILVSQDVPYPASAKKHQLIEILQTHVLPNAQRIIRQRDKVKRTSEGISNARSNQELLDEEYAQGPTDPDDRLGELPPRTPRTSRKRTAGSKSASRASTADSGTGGIGSDLNDGSLSVSNSFSTRKRRSTRQSTVESDIAEPAIAQTPLRAPAATPSARSTTTRRSRTRQSDNLSFPTPRASSSAANISQPPPSAPDAPLFTEDDVMTPIASKTPRMRREESVFSNDNPFQRGSPATFDLHPSTIGSATASRTGSKRPSTRLTYYKSSSATPRKRTVTPQIKEEQRSSPLAPAYATGYEEKKQQQQQQQQPSRSPTPRKSAGSVVPETEEESGAESYDENLYATRELSREVGDEMLETPVGRGTSVSLSRSASLGPEPGEEFTPEEQLSLEEEAAATGMWEEVDAYHPKASKRASKAARTIKMIFLSFLGLFVAWVALWYRREKVEIGYCGVGKLHWDLREYPNIPEFVHEYLEPTCELCPQHAYCYPTFEARCEPSFIARNHPLSLKGLVPLPITCEPDSEKARRVKSVVDKAIEMLREQRARSECRERGRNGKIVSQPEMTVKELKEAIGKLRRKGMGEEEFESLWKNAIGEIGTRDEVVTSMRGMAKNKNIAGSASSPRTAGDQLTFSSTSLSRLSLTCSLRRSFRLTLLAYRLPLFLLISALGAVFYVRHHIRTLRAEKARIPSLVNMTLDRLATQAALHARSAAVDPWISIAQLRDDVLRDESRKKRERMWQGVKAVVEANANVRASVRESRTGDITRVWEWIGGIGGVGGGDWWMNTARKVKPEESQLPNEHPLEDVTNDLVKVEKTDQDEKKVIW